MVMEDFLQELSSSAPVPGGGGVSALVAALAASLCSMVGNLTTGKKKYEEFQDDIERIIAEACIRRDSLYSYIEKDAKAFEPLSRAYGIPKDDPSRDEILEGALKDAASAPMQLLEELSEMMPMMSELVDKGSKLAISDVGVAATLAKSAAEGAIMNVYINTKLMKNREVAVLMNEKAEEYLGTITGTSEIVYEKVLNQLK